jgi:hypothetical protein
MALILIFADKNFCRIFLLIRSVIPAFIADLRYRMETAINQPVCDGNTAADQPSDLQTQDTHTTSPPNLGQFNQWNSSSLYGNEKAY